uniref:Candidate secreted effector n=1 Tax=Meloidogyne incognita TaxID=6306 RepID=A0A914LJG9_MELIC
MFIRFNFFFLATLCLASSGIFGWDLEGFDVFDANEENSVKENKRGGQKKTEDAKNVDTYKTDGSELHTKDRQDNVKTKVEENKDSESVKNLKGAGGMKMNFGEGDDEQEFEFLGVGGIQASEKDSIKENKRGNQEKSENAKNVDIYNKNGSELHTKDRNDEIDTNIEENKDSQSVKHIKGAGASQIKLKDNNGDEKPQYKLDVPQYRTRPPKVPSDEPSSDEPSLPPAGPPSENDEPNPQDQPDLVNVNGFEGNEKSSKKENKKMNKKEKENANNVDIYNTDGSELHTKDRHDESITNFEENSDSHSVKNLRGASLTKMNLPDGNGNEEPCDDATSLPSTDAPSGNEKPRQHNIPRTPRPTRSPRASRTPRVHQPEHQNPETENSSTDQPTAGSGSGCTLLQKLAKRLGRKVNC